MGEKRENKFEKERARQYLSRGRWGMRGNMLSARSGLRYTEDGEPTPRRFRRLGSWGSAIVGVLILFGVPTLVFVWLASRN